MEALKPMIMDFMLKYPILSWILMGLGALVVLAQIVVSLTPTKDDDAFVAKVKGWPVVGGLITLLESFAPLQKSSEGMVLSTNAAQPQEPPKA